MSRLEGGLFSTVSGNNNGLVFGKARTRDGKKTTVRQLVKPSNPRTTGQVNQRNRFKAALDIVQKIGRPLWSVAWSNVIGGLAGFQALMSRFTDALSEEGLTLSALAETTLGNLFFPASFSASAGVDQIDVTWSTAFSEPGDASDIATVIVVEVTDAGPDFDRTVIIDRSAIRSDGAVIIPASGVAAGDFIVGLYFEDGTGLEPSASKFSSAKWVVIS